MLTRSLRRFALGALGLSLVACAAPLERTEAGDQGAAETEAGLRLCAAVRGNGELVLAHFASLARIVEHYGVVDGMAGGSSGSLTTFTVESMLAHPELARCGGSACTEDAKATRLALLLKSVEGYADVVAGSPEAVAVTGLAGLATRIQRAYADKGIAALGPTEAAEAATRLREVLSVPEVRDAVNPEVFTMLADQEHLAFNVRELQTSISQLGAFAVDDDRLFFRAGVLSWPALAGLFGRVGDFYAGYGPSDLAGARAWLDGCAEATVGKPWEDAAKVPSALPAHAGATCGDLFRGLVTAYRTKVRAGATYASRLDEAPGGGALHAVVTTAVVGGETVARYASALAEYRRGVYPTGQIPFSPSFDDVTFGYWGGAADLAKIDANPRGWDDLKTHKRETLGRATWRTILAASPAEPGLSRFVGLPHGRLSAGGWSDLAPSLALANLGCRHVVYVTREGDESKFAVAIAKHLGMSEAEWHALYDLATPASSYARSIAGADAVWCTRWNDFGIGTMHDAVLDAYDAPMETRDGWRALEGARGYEGASAGRPRCRACAPFARWSRPR